MWSPTWTTAHARSTSSSSRTSWKLPRPSSSTIEWHSNKLAPSSNICAPTMEAMPNCSRSNSRGMGLSTCFQLPTLPSRTVTLSESIAPSSTFIVRAMLIQSGGFNKAWWAEAIMLAVHIYNRMPHTALGGNVPIHHWSGNVPLIVHLHPFGLKVKGVMPLNKQAKLKPKKEDYIFVGFALNTALSLRSCWLLQEHPPLQSGQRRQYVFRSPSAFCTSYHSHLSTNGAMSLTD